MPASAKRWVISSAGQPEEQLDLKKPTALRGAVGVRNCESGDRDLQRGGDSMRNLEMGTLSWSVDDAGKLVGDQVERLESSDHVESASVSYTWAAS